MPKDDELWIYELTPEVIMEAYTIVNTLESVPPKGEQH